MGGIVSEGATFLATMPPILSAMKVSGDGGMRIQFDVPESEIAEALKILLWRERVLEVTIRPANDG